MLANGSSSPPSSRLNSDSDKLAKISSSPTVSSPSLIPKSSACSSSSPRRPSASRASSSRSSSRLISGISSSIRETTSCSCGCSITGSSSCLPLRDIRRIIISTSSKPGTRASRTKAQVFASRVSNIVGCMACS